MRLKMKDDYKLSSIQRKHKKYCEWCGHTLSFYPFEKDKKLCDWCGHYNYRNDLAKFKDLVTKKKREVEHEYS